MTKTVCHWFFNSSGDLYNQNIFTKTYLFKPPASIAGKMCRFKLSSIALGSQLPTPISIYMKGLTFSQNNTIDPAFEDYGEIDAMTFLKLVGDENRSQLIGNLNNMHTGTFSEHTPELIVYIPPGPTTIEIGIYTNLHVDSDLWEGFNTYSITSNVNDQNVRRQDFNGIIIASTSNQLYNASTIFSNGNTTPRTISSEYNPTTGEYAGDIQTMLDNSSSNVIYGAWVQYTMQYGKIFEQVTIQRGTEETSPRRIVIVASDDESHWVKIYESQEDIVYNSNGFITLEFGNRVPYKSYRIIVLLVGTPGNASTNCNVIRFHPWWSFQTKMPPGTMTSNTTDLSATALYMKGVYTCYSEPPSEYAHRLFNNNRGFGTTVSTRYDVNTGNYNGPIFTKDSFTGELVFGDYVDITCPRSFVLQAIRIDWSFYTAAPRRGAIFGSNDGTNYYLIDGRFLVEDYQFYTGSIPNIIYMLCNPKGMSFRTFRFVFTEAAVRGFTCSGLGMGEIDFFGFDVVWSANAHLITEIEAIEENESS
jgi:hypothetical protein